MEKSNDRDQKRTCKDKGKIISKISKHITDFIKKERWQVPLSLS